MPLNYIHYNVVISCPSDMNSSRRIVEDAVRKANEQYGDMLNCHMEVKYWTKDVLFTHGDPQELINRGIIDNADLVIALFGAKLGTPTAKAESGTVEEIQEMIKKGKDTIVCFSDKNLTFNTSEGKKQIQEWNRLQNFKDEYRGLYVSFKTDEELAAGLENQLRLFLTKKNLERGVQGQGTLSEPKEEKSTDEEAYDEPAEPRKHGILDKLFDAMRIEEGADDEYEEYESIRNPFKRTKQPQVVLIKLEYFEDAPKVLEYLKSGKCVLTDLTGMDVDMAQRSLDFINGGAYYADGEVRQFSNSVFVVSPAGITVSADSVLDGLW